MNSLTNLISGDFDIVVMTNRLVCDIIGGWDLSNNFSYTGNVQMDKATLKVVVSTSIVNYPKDIKVSDIPCKVFGKEQTVRFIFDEDHPDVSSHKIEDLYILKVV